MELTGRCCWCCVVAVVLVLTLLTSDAAAAGHSRRRPKRQHARQGQEDGQPLMDDALPFPVRHEDHRGVGVPVGEAATASECPPARPFSRELCGAPACLYHHRCPAGRACCFNGCVHTCLLAVDSPPVIDWLEDTSSLLPILEGSPRPSLPVRYEDPAFAEGREEAVHLSGGCTISGTQYTQLQNFMKAPSIENCMCEKGEVVCAVKMFQS